MNFGPKKATSIYEKCLKFIGELVFLTFKTAEPIHIKIEAKLLLKAILGLVGKMSQIRKVIHYVSLRLDYLYVF